LAPKVSIFDAFRKNPLSTFTVQERKQQKYQHPLLLRIIKD